MLEIREQENERVPLDPLLDVEDVATLLGVSPFIVRQWCNHGILPAFKIGPGSKQGKPWKMFQSKILRFMEEQEQSWGANKQDRPQTEGA